MPMQYHELCGVIHIHTTFSDGGVDFPRLIETAQDAGLDFIVINDHMTLRGKHEGYDGFNGNLLVVVGYEHHDDNGRNHYLILGVDTVITESNTPQAYINRTKQLGGIGFLAHPMERRHYFKQYPPYPWTDWSVTGFDGIEMWNQMSEWVENLKKWRSYVRIFYPRRFLKNISPELCRKWDELNRVRFVSGIGGVDAHTIKFKLGCIHIRIFPLKVELKGVRTHLYVREWIPGGNACAAQRLFLDALRDGHGFISNFRRGDARGTRMFAQLPSGELLPPGRPTRPVEPPLTLLVSLPRKAEIRCVRNGSVWQSANASSARFEIDATGVYRIEAYLKRRAWIYSNPFPVGSYPL